MSRPSSAAWALGLVLVSGCASYKGTARHAEPERIALEPGWVGIANLPEVRQAKNKDCGAAALSSVLSYWGQASAPEEIDDALSPGPNRGLRAGDLRDYARKRGLVAFTFYGRMEDVKRELEYGRPVIVGTIKPYDGGNGLAHYEVVVGYHEAKRLVVTMDPAHGFRQNTLAGFLGEWAASHWVTLVVMAPPQEPTSTPVESDGPARGLAQTTAE